MDIRQDRVTGIVVVFCYYTVYNGIVLQIKQAGYTWLNEFYRSFLHLDRSRLAVFSQFQFLC